MEAEHQNSRSSRIAWSSGISDGSLITNDELVAGIPIWLQNTAPLYRDKRTGRKLYIKLVKPSVAFMCSYYQQVNTGRIGAEGEGKGKRELAPPGAPHPRPPPNEREIARPEQSWRWGLTEKSERGIGGIRRNVRSGGGAQILYFISTGTVFRFAPGSHAGRNVCKYRAQYRTVHCLSGYINIGGVIRSLFDLYRDFR